MLLVSTDPASNLDEVLGVELSGAPEGVPLVPRLSALNIDPEAAARDYRERVVGPYRGVLPEAAVASIEEQLSGACTMEIAAFDEFSKLLGDEAATEAFDYVVFDAAPTGHTLRLLELPAAWSDFIETNVGGTSCLGPLAGLEAQKELYAATNAALRDAARTTLVLVARPEASSLREAERTRGELAQLGIGNRPADRQRGVSGHRPRRCDGAHDAGSRRGGARGACPRPFADLSAWRSRSSPTASSASMR